MRDSGLEQAIRAAGGVGALARKIGIAQPSVSNWNRVPAERLVAVEAATGVHRTVLRPDLFDAAAADGEIDEIELARAQILSILDGTPHQQRHAAKIVELGLRRSVLVNVGPTDVQG